MTTRRSFLSGIFGAAIAPAFIGSEILMPVKKLWTPPEIAILENYSLYNNIFQGSVLSIDKHLYTVVAIHGNKLKLAAWDMSQNGNYFSYITI